MHAPLSGVVVEVAAAEGDRLPAGAALLLLVALAQAAALALGREPPHLPRGDAEEALDAGKVARAE